MEWASAEEQRRPTRENKCPCDMARAANLNTPSHYTRTAFQAFLEGECPLCPQPPGQNTNSWLACDLHNGYKSYLTSSRSVYPPSAPFGAR